MESTAIRLGGVELASSVMNASGPRSSERSELLELAGAHQGAIVFKSCNAEGLAAPDNLKNHGVEYYSEVAQELVGRGRKVVASVVGASETEFVEVSRALDRAGVQIIELNLADPWVIARTAPFASIERLKSLVGRVRGATRCALGVKIPIGQGGFEPRAIADVLKSLRVTIAVCANDIPRDLSIDVKTGVIGGPARALSQANAFFRAAEGLIDIVAVGGINTGHDALIAHLMGAKAVQVGSALIKEGVGAITRIDFELGEELRAAGFPMLARAVGLAKFAG
jgi:dihydroorotate dehydrogenase